MDARVKPAHDAPTVIAGVKPGNDVPETTAGREIRLAPVER
jgi:hypothetical protein